MTASPFDQFEIIRIIPIHPFGNLDISVTNSTIFMFIALITFYALMEIEKGYLVPTRWQSVVEVVYETMHGMIKETVGSTEEETRYFPFIFVLFVFVALMNVYGLVPYTFTPTAHVFVTFGLSLSIFLACTLIGLIQHKWNYFAMFMPYGAPMALGPFIIIIEFMSHCAKAISLGVRLAANMTAGHLLFSIFAGFTWGALTAGGLMSLGSIVLFGIVFGITVLEMAVAFIQAYIFCLLTTVYLNEAIHLH